MLDKSSQGPRIPRWILQRFLPETEALYLNGDFDEIYSRILYQKGKTAAALWYWRQLIHWIPLLLSHSIRWSLTMFKNYCKILFRNLKRQKGYSLINLAGLSVGIAGAVLIILVVRYEFKYESHHENAHRIYRVNIEQKRPDSIFRSYNSPVPLAENLYNELPEIIQFSRFLEAGQSMVSFQERKFYESALIFADPGALVMFSFPFISGDSETALDGANHVILTEEMAEKYFGNQDPMGKTLVVDGNLSLQVTGVIKNHPPFSNIRPDFLVSFSTLKSVVSAAFFQNWISQQLQSFIMFSNDINIPDMEAKILQVFSRFIREDDLRILQLDQLKSMHLHSQARPTGNLRSLYILLAVGLLILLTACINFMNLATARSTKRAKEVGLRKVAGAVRQQIVRQFIGESMIYAALSLVLGLVLVYIFLPVVNTLTGQSMVFSDLGKVGIMAGLLGIFLLVGFLSGSYPAFFLSAFQPAGVMKGSFAGGRGSALFRRILVVVQFGISILLIICSMIFGRQLHYIQNKPLGFEKDRIVIVRNNSDLSRRDIQPFKTELLRNPSVVGVSGSLQLPSSIGMYNNVTWEGAVNEEEIEIIHNTVDYDFLNTYDIKLIAGRNFSPEFPGDIRSRRDPKDAGAVILNQEAVRRFGWDDPVGKTVIQTYGSLRINYKVIGVIRDFHFTSLRNAIQPLKLFFSPSDNRYISLRLKTDSVSDSLAFIEDAWNRVYPGSPFEYFFYDEVFERRYRSEARLKQLFGYFSGLAVFIACLGLLGLAAYEAEKRTKEIGIRKILGASSPNITLLLTKEFARLVVAANLIAWPAAYFAMNKWLGEFAYRINLNSQLVFFMLAGVTALLIALLTVGFQAVKASFADPVKSLRYE